MRLPFFAGITILRLCYCTFQFLRAMLAAVWACPNLAVLIIRDISFTAERRSTVAGLRQMSAAVEHLKVCQKLTSLHVDKHILQGACDYDITGLSGVGGIFGCAITELYFVGKPDSCTIGRPIPGSLKTIFLQQHHQDQTGYERDFCQRAVGTSEEVVGSEKRLPELLAGLEALTFRFERCKDPGKCVAPFVSERGRLDAQGVGMPADGVAALASTTAALQSAKAHGSDIVCTE
ncbi:hypothetical protein VTO73DRAFT_11882 [Trametes versicolor]